MKDREPMILAWLIVLLLLLWLGFLLHSSPRFAGSLWGGILGVSGGLLMVSTLIYPLVKRIGPLKRWVTTRASMRTLLIWHMYAGMLGAILGILHGGHKFNSPLGISLTATAIVAVISGFVGRQLMKQVSTEIREKKEQLTRLEIAYRRTAGELLAQPAHAAVLRPFTRFWWRLTGAMFLRNAEAGAPTAVAARALRLADAIADLEYAIKTHATFKRWFTAWLALHIIASVILYVLLGLHVWSGIHFGLRWFE